MKNIEIKQNEELEKVPVTPGDIVFVKYEKAHRPEIRIFKNAIPILLLLMVMSIGVSRAETGSIIISDDKTLNYATAMVAQARPYNLSWIFFDNTSFNYLSSFHFHPSAVTFAHDFESTSFSIVSGATGGTGLVSYDKNNSVIYYVFSSDTIVTGSTIIIHPTVNIFVNITLGDCSNDAIGATIPVGIFCTTPNGVSHPSSGNYHSVTIATRGIDLYSVIYPLPGWFSVNITKNPYVNSKYYIHGTTSIYSQETTYNKVSIVGAFFAYNDGLWLNATLSSGIYTNQLINSSGAGLPIPPATPTPDPLTGSGLLWSKDNYTIHEIGTLQYLTDGSFFDPIASYWIDIVNVNDGGVVTKFDGLGTSGSISYQFPNVGSYETYYKRCALLSCLFPETIASTVVTANKGQPSQIFPNATYKLGIPSNLSYYLNQYYETDFYFYYWSEDAQKYIPSYGKYNTPIGYGNVSFNCGVATTWKITLDGAVAFTKCVSDNTQAGFNITASFLNVSSATPKLLDYLEIEYGVDSVSWVGNNTFIKVYDKNGINVFTYPVGIQYDQVPFFLVYVAHEFSDMVVSTGANTIKLELEDGTVLASRSITVSEINDNGYGLILQKHDFCINEKVAFKYYAPADVNLSLYQDDVFLKKAFLPASVNGNNTWVFISKPGTYSIRLTYNNVQYADDVITITDCVGISPTPTPSGTQQASQLINLLTSNIFWALIIVGGLMIMIAFKTRDGMATGIIGIFAMGIFSFLGWLPLWIFFTVFIIAALFIGISIVTKQMENVSK